MRRLALDHLTVVDAVPAMLAQVARETGCDGICLFLRSMDVLPLMPGFDLIADRRARAEAKAAIRDHDVTVDVAYPFTLAGRSEVAAFAPAMECAAQLGARMINVLAYDRDPARRVERFGAFCEQAAGFGLDVAVEFYPPSRIPSLAAALDLVRAIGMPGRVGVNVDLLHLMRSGGSIADLAAAPAGSILYGQLADGPPQPTGDIDAEASSERRLCGEGVFDAAGFVRALPPGCPVSVEVPRDSAIRSETMARRAARAVASVRMVMAEAGS